MAQATKRVPDDERIREMARNEFASDGTIEIDSDAVVSISEDQDGPQGAYVAAWVYVEFTEANDAD